MKKNPFLNCVAVLGGICLCVALILGVVNFFTAPIIRDREDAAANAAYLEVLPDATTFTDLDLSLLPAGSTVTVAKKDDGGSGYAFQMVTKGFSDGLTIVCGIDPDGTITGVRTLASNETAGYGKVCEEESYYSQYTGKGSAELDGIAISGATVTSNAYRNAIKDAFAAFSVYAGVKTQVSETDAALECVPGATWVQAVSGTSAYQADTGALVLRCEQNGIVLFVGVGSDGVVTGAYLYEGEGSDPARYTGVTAETVGAVNDPMRDAVQQALTVQYDQINHTRILQIVQSVLPDASDFEQLTLPGQVHEGGQATGGHSTAATLYADAMGAYRVAGQGYVFLIYTDGYSQSKNGPSERIRIAAALDEAGALIRSKVLYQSETQQFGVDKVLNNDAFTGSYEGKTEAGSLVMEENAYATYTYNGYHNAMKAAFAAYALIAANGGAG